MGRIGWFTTLGLLTLAIPAVAEDPGTRAKASAFARLLGDEALRPVAVEALTALGEDAVPGLAEVLADAQAPARPQIAALLAKLGAKSELARSALRAASLDRDPPTRVAVLRARIALGDDAGELVPGIVSAMVSPDEAVRQSAAEALKEAGKDAKSAIPVLMRALEDPDANVRRTAGEALTSMGVAAVDTLDAGMKSEDPVLRTAAVRAIGAMGQGGKGAVPSMIAVLKDAEEDPVLRRETARALGAVGPAASAAVEDLLALATAPDLDPGLRAESLTALEKIGPGDLDVATRLRALLRHENERLRAFAAAAIGAKGTAGKAAAADLLLNLNDLSHAVRNASALALARVAPDAPTTLAAL